MFRERKRGFTIVEVILFLAISSVLLAVIISTIGGRQQRTQFTDSMRDLQSFAETQLSDTQSGVNPVGQGNDEETLMLGRALAFKTPIPGSITVYTVSGDRLTAEDAADCPPATTLSCSNPKIITVGGHVYEILYEILWGAEFYDGRFQSGDGTDTIKTQTMAFLRDPRGTRIIPITYKYDATVTTLQQIENPATYNDLTTMANNVDAYYCFRSANTKMTAVLTLVGTQVDLVFDPPIDEYQCSGG